MNLFVSNQSIYFLPIFTLNQNGDYSAFAIFLLLLKLFFFILSFFFTFLLCKIIRISRIFHPNLNFLLISLLLQWIECSIAVLLIFPFQNGIVQVDGFEKNRVYINWVTIDEATIPRANHLNDVIFLLIGSFLYIHYLTTISFISLIVLIERGLAIFLIKDYEKKPRKYIRFTLFFLLQIGSLIFSSLVLTRHINIMSGTFVVAIFVALSVAMYIYLWHENRKIDARIKDMRDDFYSLPIRYQSRENAKTFKIGKQLAAFFLLVITFEIIFLRNFIKDSDTVVSTTQIEYDLAALNFLHTVNSLNPIWFTPTCLMTVREWRIVFFRWIRVSANRSVHEIQIGYKEKTISEVTLQTNAYFNQLKKAWQ